MRHAAASILALGLALPAVAAEDAPLIAAQAKLDAGDVLTAEGCTVTLETSAAAVGAAGSAPMLSRYVFDVHAVDFDGWRPQVALPDMRGFLPIEGGTVVEVAWRGLDDRDVAFVTDVFDATCESGVCTATMEEPHVVFSMETTDERGMDDLVLVHDALAAHAAACAAPAQRRSGGSRRSDQGTGG
ncbi:hypothetical protein DXV76_11325 [Rhodobacteraceae bacterium CCMM004]|nr:hypothetical protein DXV76_11325 [Rhodobacteraceae bacterium CCMM004]